MIRPTTRFVIAVYGVLFCAAALVYFGFVSPLKPGDHTPKGGRHTEYSIVGTYAVFCALLVMCFVDVIRAVRRKEAFVHLAEFKVRMSFPSGQWQCMGAVSLEPGERLRVTVRILDAPADVLHLILALRPASVTGETADVLEVRHSRKIWWEADNRTEIYVSPRDSIGPAYDALVMATSEPPGTITAKFSGARARAPARVRAPRTRDG